MKWLLLGLARLPLPVLQRIGAFIAWLLWVMNSSRRRTAVTNVRRCFPELPPDEQLDLARRAIAHEINAFLETPLVWLGADARVLALVKEWHGLEIFEAAFRQGRGMLLLTLHQGSFEAGAIPLSARFRLGGVYKPQKGVVQELSIRGRSRYQGILVPAIGGSVSSKMLEIIDQGYGAYFMPDQDPPEGRGVFAPFFGIQAHTPTLVHRLLQARPGLPVVHMWVERLPRAAGFHVHFRAASAGVHDPDPVAHATALNQDLEQFVRSRPEQYWWGYRRFRRRPPGEPAFY